MTQNKVTERLKISELEIANRDTLYYYFDKYEFWGKKIDDKFLKAFAKELMGYQKFMFKKGKKETKKELLVKFKEIKNMHGDITWQDIEEVLK